MEVEWFMKLVTQIADEPWWVIGGARTGQSAGSPGELWESRRDDTSAGPGRAWRDRRKDRDRDVSRRCTREQGQGPDYTKWEPINIDKYETMECGRERVIERTRRWKRRGGEWEEDQYYYYFTWDATQPLATLGGSFWVDDLVLSG